MNYTNSLFLAFSLVCTSFAPAFSQAVSISGNGSDNIGQVGFGVQTAVNQTAVNQAAVTQPLVNPFDTSATTQVTQKPVFSDLSVVQPLAGASTKSNQMAIWADNRGTWQSDGGSPGCMLQSYTSIKSESCK